MRLLDGIQSTLNPQGPDAAIIAEMSWVLFAGATAIFLAVMGLAAYAVFASRARTQRLSPRLLVVGGGIVFPVVTLFALLVYSLARAGSLHPVEDNALRIEVVGEQWWWRVHYLDAEGRRDFATANEIRVPAGRPVELLLRSGDVVHSFWVPVLAGKLDMIPGRTNRLRVRAAQPGEFRGQCAEYCGGPHAFMSLYFVAEEPARFEQWRDAQRRPAAQGNELFVANCASCHTVRGTPAAGVLGPDLTHVGSRLSIGAGMLPTNEGALAGWIASSQHLKPGNLMPSFQHFSGEELRSLAAYLGSLQ
ncbi:MAG TPA: cytochrome c oxidase subunit II [Burkholderiales bacterium]|nr:cytochrome c oxidase subunit II [Burkholderiales bacterium]